MCIITCTVSGTGVSPNEKPVVMSLVWWWHCDGFPVTLGCWSFQSFSRLRESLLTAEPSSGVWSRHKDGPNALLSGNLAHSDKQSTKVSPTTLSWKCLHQGHHVPDIQVTLIEHISNSPFSGINQHLTSLTLSSAIGEWPSLYSPVMRNKWWAVHSHGWNWPDFHTIQLVFI